MRSTSSGVLKKTSAFLSKVFQHSHAMRVKHLLAAHRIPFFSILHEQQLQLVTCNTFGNVSSNVASIMMFSDPKNNLDSNNKSDENLKNEEASKSDTSTTATSSSATGENKKHVHYDKSYVMEVYSYMYPDDPAFSNITNSRIKTISLFLYELEGNVPFMITTSTRMKLKSRGVTDGEIDRMRPLQASAYLFKLEHEK